MTPTLSPWRLSTAVFGVSAGVIGLELALMRGLAIGRWYHFSALVISAALLGFAASGTGLTFLRRWLLARGQGGLIALSAAFGATCLLAHRLGESLPVEVQFPPLEWLGHLAWWVGYWLTWCVPFLAGGAFIGLALMLAGRRIGLVYGSTMAGSGCGAAGMVAAMAWLDAGQLVWFPAIAGGLAALVLIPPTRRGVAAMVAGGLAFAALAGWQHTDPAEWRMDPYKAAARYQLLADQGSAEQLLQRDGLRGRVEVYASDLVHDLLFLAPQAIPPPAYAMLVNGDLAGTLFAIENLSQAAVMDKTLPAVAYRLLTRPRVLLLGETGGVNVWLARRQRAAAITVVQPNGVILDVLQQRLADRTGHVLGAPEIGVVQADPRAFVEATEQAFDLIQVVAMEGLPAGSAGTAGLAANFLATQEGFARCLDRLSPHGLLVITRGLQTPPRDNLRLAGLVVAALGSRGITAPGEHVAQVRDYLSACTLASPSPLSEEQIASLRQAVEELGLTAEWYPQIDPSTLNQPDALPGPAGTNYSWLHHGWRELLAGRGEALADEWVYDVRPPTDDRPYFGDFFRWRTFGEIRRTYGRQWLAHAELGYWLLVVALVVATVIAAFLILLPLGWLVGEPIAGGHRLAIVGYFGGLGFGYMLLEIALITCCTLWVGDPVLAGALVLAAFLISSGVGSTVLTPRLGTGFVTRGLLPVVGGILVLSAGWWLGGHAVFRPLAGQPTVVRALLAAIGLAPLALLMGGPFPSGLARLERSAKGWLPWAWAINGFGSVVGSVLAAVLAMSAGFRWVMAAGMVCYGVALAASAGLPGARQSGK